MFSKTLSAVAVALAASSIVSAQTSTICNPLKQDCPADPAFGKKGGNCDFTKGECSVFHTMDGTPVKYDSRGAVFSMSKAGQAPTLRSNNYLFFGRVDVEMQAAPGGGIVTSIVLLSDDLDEIDFETVGGDNKQIQSNYFSKGDDSTFNRGGFHAVDNPLGAMHTYSFEWTPEKADWLINGQVVRTLKASDVGGKFPQSPMQVKLGAWVAGYEGNAQGTIEWAGGIADFSKGPISAIYKSVKITDYAGGSSATDKDVKEYVFGDRSGSAKSIQVKLNDGSSSPGGDDKSTKSEESSKTTSAEKSSSAAATTSSASADSTTLSTAKSTVASTPAASTTSRPSSAPSSSGTPAATPPSVPAAAPRNGMAAGALVLAAAVAVLAL